MKRILNLAKKIKPIHVLLLSFLIVVGYFNFIPFGEQHFSFLAQSFLHGKTYFLTMPGRWADTVFFNNHYYWPLGFFPAVLLMPFNYIFNHFGLFFYQGYLQFFLGIFIIYFIYKISKKYSYSGEESIYWAFAFCFCDGLSWTLFVIF